MTIITHIASGVAIGSVYLSLTNTDINPSTILLVSVLMSVLPDINVLWIRNLLKHHSDITHYPLFWIALFSALFIINRYIVKIPLEFLTLGLINISAHMLMDTFGLRVGIKWFYPFLDKDLSFTTLAVYKRNRLPVKRALEFSISNRLLFIELGIVLLSLFILWRRVGL